MSDKVEATFHPDRELTSPGPIDSVSVPAPIERVSLAGVEARVAGATPGPWELDWDGQELYVAPADADDNPWKRVAEWTYAVATLEPYATVERAECETSNATLIAAAPTDLAALAGAVRAVLAEIERVKYHYRNYAETASRLESEAGDYALGRWEVAHDVAGLLHSLQADFTQALSTHLDLGDL